MPASLYNNLPKTSTTDNNSTSKKFENYYKKPLELDSNTLAAIQGFFVNRGFDSAAAESIAVIIINQAKKDGYNPMEIMNTLTGLDEVNISNLVAEILNANRFKSSYLGYARKFDANQEIKRNILA